MIQTGFVRTTNRGRLYGEEDGLGIWPAIIGAAALVGTTAFGAFSGRASEKKAKKAEKKRAQALAAEKKKQEEEAKRIEAEAEQRATALALAEQQRAALEAQAADARAAAGRATLQGLVGPGVVLGVLGLVAWFALGRRG